MPAARSATKDPPPGRPELAPDSDPAALAERHLLGALLHGDAATARDALRWVPPEDFSDPQLRAIAQGIGSLAAQGIDPQPALIAPTLVELGLVPRQLAGLANALLVDLLTGVPVPQSWPSYAATVAGSAMRRDLIAAAQKLAQAAETGRLETCVSIADEAAQRAHGRLARLSGGTR